MMIAGHLELRGVAILLDVDGTLLDIVPEPADVHVPPSLQRALARLKKQTDGALAFVSGRLLTELDRFFAPLRLAGIGVHGAEIRTSADGMRVLFNAKPLEIRLKRRLMDVAEACPGVVTEDKCYSLALHYRRAPEHEHMLREAIARLCADVSLEEVEVLEGKSVIEIKSGRFSKGKAFRQLMAWSPFAGRQPIFVGDDKTDEDVFAALPEFGGIGISVGGILPGASHEIETPDQVRQWLEEISGAYDRDAS
jgi:trehalose 6-phosphate phosphatase